MRIVKYYREIGGKVQIRLRKLGRCRGIFFRGLSVSKADEQMEGMGYARRRPSSLKPHHHPHQQPGYRQPSQQALRGARRTIRQGGRQAVR